MTTKTKTSSAFEELDTLRTEARARHARAGERESEARGAGRRLEAARRALLDFLTGVEVGAAKPDPERERKLRAELRAVEHRTTVVYEWTQGKQVSRPVDFEADSRLEAARIEADEADQRVAEFIAERRGEMAEELSARALRAGDELARAVEALSAADGEWRTTRRLWVELLGVSPSEVPSPPLPGIALGDIDLVVAQVRGGAKDARGFIPLPIEPLEDEEEAPSAGALRGWQHVPRVLSSAGGLGA